MEGMKRDTSVIKFRLNYEDIPLFRKEKSKNKLAKGVLGLYPNSGYGNPGLNRRLFNVGKSVKPNN